MWLASKLNCCNGHCKVIIMTTNEKRSKNKTMIAVRQQSVHIEHERCIYRRGTSGEKE